MELKTATAEILSTGNEVLWGEVDDTNASWLSQRLRESGIDVRRVSCIGDDINDIAGIMREISNRSKENPVDVVLVTGGLGPTSDDLSAEAAALACEDPLIFNEAAMKSMEAYFNKRGWPMPESNIKQVMLPSKAGLMENSCGTAPGFYVRCNKTMFYFMPGVPSEMRAMYQLSVLPHIKGMVGLNTEFVMNRIKLFGLPESKVGTRLNGFEDAFPDFILGFRASFPIIEVKVSTAVQQISVSGGGEDEGFDKLAFDTDGAEVKGGQVRDDVQVRDLDRKAESEKQAMAAGEWIASRLEGNIISMDGLDMEEEVGRLLVKMGKSVAVAESCTGGLIANMLTDVAGSSEYFLLSAVTYSNEAKIQVLGVDPKTIEVNGAVHELTVEEMASGARNAAGADFGLATSGIAGPGGGTDDKPVGTICIGLAAADGVASHRFRFNFDHRSLNKKMFAVKALDLLRRELLKTVVDPR